MCIYFVLKNGWASLKNHYGSFEGLVKITVLMGVTIFVFFCHLKKGHFQISLLLSLYTVPKIKFIVKLVVCFQRGDAKEQTHSVG